MEFCKLLVSFLCQRLKVYCNWLSWTFQQKDLEKADFLVRQGLDEDEKGNKDEALPLYMDAAELCLRTVSQQNIDDPPTHTPQKLEMVLGSISLVK